MTNMTNMTNKTNKTLLHVALKHSDYVLYRNMNLFIIVEQTNIKGMLCLGIERLALLELCLHECLYLLRCLV